MPNVTVYIRVDDLDKWKALKGKSQFIHNALHKESKKAKETKETKSTEFEHFLRKKGKSG